MLFHSFGFIFGFLPFVFLVYFYLNQRGFFGLGKGVLVGGSLFFYAWWSLAYLPIILGSMLFNFLMGVWLGRGGRKPVLVFGIVANLALLGYFKYADFLIENLNFVTGAGVPTLGLVLPLAISFFTFQQISFLVDCYRQECRDLDWLNYALFVSFFPQLIAGPIVHHKEMMPQFANLATKLKNYDHIAKGLFLFSIGLFKKVVIADRFAVWANAGFAGVEPLHFVAAWATSLSYTFQLYFDFSGYTDMAIGLALLFNIHLPINFNSPYKATSIQAFWRRWHITLSRFLKDYVYIPLGGNRCGWARTYTNLVATFVIGGLWHGAGWTFIGWGLLHGLALVVHRIWQRLGGKMWAWLAWLITFNFINLTWVFFRAETWDDSLRVLRGMMGLSGITLHNRLSIKMAQLSQYGIEFGDWLALVSGNKWTVILLILGFVLIASKNSIQLAEKFVPNTKTFVFNLFLFFAALASLNVVSEFLYFNF